MQSNSYDNIQEFEMLMKEASEQYLNRKIKRRRNNYNKIIEPIWFMSEIKKEISK